MKFFSIVSLLILAASCGGGLGTGDPCTPGAGDCPAGQVCDVQTMTCQVAAQCTAHGDCPLGQHCAGTVCETSTLGSPCDTADQCILGQECTMAGLCGCDGERFDAEQKEAEILVVLDRSGSMAYSGATPVPEPNKWSEAKGAVNTMTGAFPSIDFGLFMYPEGQGCPVSSPQVAVAANNASMVSMSMESSHPSAYSLTPILETLTLVEQNSYFVDPAKNHAVAFITDGYHSSSDCQTPVVSSAADAASTVANIFALGTKVFAIGFGTNADTDLLNQVAQAGGTGQYIDATDGPALTAALNTIATSVSNCQYTLSTQNVTDMVVLLNNQMIPEDGTNGFTFDPASNEITFHGTTCDMLINAASTTDVVIATGCDVVIQ